MSVRLHAVRVAAPVLLAATGLSVLAASPASAESGSIDYTCTASILLAGAPQGQFPTTVEGLKAQAKIDTAIEDGGTVAVGSTVTLSPVRVTMTLPAATTKAALTSVHLPVANVFGQLGARIAETDLKRGADLQFDELHKEDSGEVTVTGTGTARPFEAARAGSYTYVSGNLEVFFKDPEGNYASLACTPDTGENTVVDQVKAKAPAATPTQTPTQAPTQTPTQAPTPSPTTSPKRPDVVQTDAAQSAPVNSTAWAPLAAAGSASILLLGAAGMRRRGARR